MTDLCPICNVTVDKNCLQCDKCKDWIHYYCSKLPAYIIIQLSKSARVFTCPSCVKSKYPLVFQKLNDDIEKIIMTPVSQPSSPKNPTTPLTPSAPPSPLFIQLTPNPLIPSPPFNFSPVISPPQQVSPTTHDPSPDSKSQVPTNPHTLQPPPIATNKAQIKPIATKSISSATPKPCKFYMQGHCRYGEKGIGCSYPHPQMCFRFIKSGHKGCSKGDSCKYAHPKLCRSSLLSHKCDRIKCYFYHVTGTVRSNLNQNLLRTNVPKRPASHPTPLMNIKLPPSHPEATDTIAFPTQTSLPPLTMPYNVAASSKTPDITSAFLDQMKELKSQMIQMQQTQNFLLKNIMSQAWPPLPVQKVAQFPAQMF